MRVLLLTAGLTACSDYNIAAPLPDFGVSEPSHLENPTRVDEIVQVTTPSVDVLWVVDNSSSMSNNQKALTDNFPSFMEYFLGSGLDYHIGVVSTDVEDQNQSGKLRQASGHRWIDADSRDPRGDFEEMARIGIAGSGNEAGRDATFLALEQERDAFNLGFLRDDDTSGIHVVLISDENDHSVLTSKDEFVAWMNGLRTDPEIVTFNSICNPPGSGLLNEAGREYIDYTEQIGGLMHDIRSEDWVQVLERLGIQAAGLRREFFLSALPVTSTIAVEVELRDGTVLPMAPKTWDYDASRNSITFDTFVPDPLATVRIDYTVLASVLEPDAFEE